MTVLGLLLISENAQASPPKVGVGLSVGPRLIVGELGENAERGLGITFSNVLRWTYLGGKVSLGTSFYSTTQEPPPFSRTFQTFFVGVGPRAYLPFRSFEVSLGADYRRIGVLSNSLVRVTGTDKNFNGLSAAAGLSFRWLSFNVNVEGSFTPLLELPGSIVGIDFGIGFQGGGQ